MLNLVFVNLPVSFKKFEQPFATTNVYGATLCWWILYLKGCKGSCFSRILTTPRIFTYSVEHNKKNRSWTRENAKNKQGTSYTNLVFCALQLTHCGRVMHICVFNTVKLGTSASSSLCHSTRGNVSRGITPSSTTRIFGEYFLKISVHKNS